MRISDWSSDVCSSDLETVTGGVQQHTFHDPVPGVWQFRMQNQQPHSREAWASILAWSAPMPLEVTIRGRRVASDATPAEGGRRVAFRGAGTGTSVRAIGIGATRTTRTRLSPGLEPKFFGVEIADGTTRQEVELGPDEPARTAESRGGEE